MSSQLMAIPEVTVGTPLTTTLTYEMLNENMQFTPTDLDSSGLKSGQQFERASRHMRSRVDAGGDFTVEHADKGHMGMLWKHALGSPLTVPVIIGATTAYDQYHVPGSHDGMALTIQTGEVQPDQTVRAFQWAGCKIIQWDFSVSDNQQAQFKVTVDSWNLDTAPALSVAAYTANTGTFTFRDATVFKIGGTPSTAAGKTTVAAGATVATICHGLTLTGTTPMKDDRYGLGNAGVKKEQIQNAIPTITGTLDAEFTQRTEFFDLYKSNTPTCLQLDMTHFDAAGNDAGGVASGPNPYLLSFILPKVYITTANANTAGPDLTQQKISFKAFDDGTTNPTIQVHLVSTDTTL
jgi:hypothetical protein